MKDLSSAFSGEVNLDKVESTRTRVESLTSVVSSMVDEIVKEVCGELDSYMEIIDQILCNSDNPVTDRELEDFTLNIPSLLYLVSSRRENLGVKEDVSKAIYKEVYNQVREKASGTVADKDTAAELASKSEAITHIVYSRAHRAIKAKEESSWEMLNSVKKVLTRRIAEMELTRQSGGV